MEIPINSDNIRDRNKSSDLKIDVDNPALNKLCLMFLQFRIFDGGLYFFSTKSSKIELAYEMRLYFFTIFLMIKFLSI